MTQSDQLRLAVFIDFDNIEIGVKNTLNASFDVGLVLDALKERGDVVSKLAYSDWQRAGGYSRALTQHAIRMVQRNMTPGGDKNGADINLALDALEMAFTHPHINAFAIVGGDSDFISLVEKLKQYDKKVFVVGGRQFTSAIMQRNCHQFIAYENLVATGGGRRASEGRASTKADGQSLESVAPLVRRALEVLSERDVLPQLGLLKSTLLQLDSTFSERSYGVGSFREFAQKLEKAGILRVQQGKGGWIVAPAGGAASQAEPAVAGEADGPESEAPGREPARAPGGGERGAPGERGTGGDRGPAPARLGQPADGVRELGAILGAATVRRWPLYLRNLKQILRQTQPAFDERAYGFANLSDLARAAHRAGLLRIERDRQGNIRMFEGKVAPAELPQAAARAVESDGDEPPAPADPADVAEAPPPADAAAHAPADEPDHEPGDVDGNRIGGPTPAPAGVKKGPARRRTASRKTAGGAAGAKKRAPRPRAKKKPA